MKELSSLLEEQLAQAEKRLRSPLPGGRIEAAKRYGVDLTLLIEQLRLSPEERVQRAHSIAIAADEVRGAARRGRQ